MQMIPIHLNTLRPNQVITFDVHLKVGDRYVHYLKNAEEFEAARKEAMIRKNIKKVFISTNDEERYLAYLDAGLGDLEKKEVAVKEKASLAQDTLATQAENIERSLDNEQAYNSSKKHLAKVVGFFTSEKSALKHMFATAGIASDNTQHSANVASYALGVATQAGVTASKDLLDLGIAALVHDLGSTKLGLDPLASRESLKGDALKRYLGHPVETVAVLSGKPFITSRVLTLVADHEEIGEGRGYPEKKYITRLSKQSQILNLCNAFDRHCMVSKLSVKEGLDSFVEKKADFFPTDLINILVTVAMDKFLDE
jgi:HD-GYP domain-containing protein (c-di-GMP phosphodiesterase class II)